MTSTDLERTLVTGGGGRVASALSFGRLLTRAQLDVTDPAAVAAALDAHRPSCILHLASLDLAACEARPADAHRVNVLGAVHVAQAARERGLPVVLVSTGAVFSAPPGAVFFEDTPPAPVQTYGHTKREAEERLTDLLGDGLLIVRTGWLYGFPGSRPPRWVRRTVAAIEAGEAVVADGRRTGSWTWSRDFARALREAMEQRRRGVLHLANEGAATGADLAREVMGCLGRRSPVRLVDAGGPPRAGSEALGSRVGSLRPWQEALADYLASRPGAEAGP